MIILDTDCLSLFDREKGLESSILRTNLERFSPEDISTSIITFEEQMRGWLTYLAKCRNIEFCLSKIESVSRKLPQNQRFTI